MKLFIARFCSATKITHLLHVNNTHETKVYKRIFTLPCFNKLKKKKKKKKRNETKTESKKQTNKKQIEKNLNI